MQRSDYPCVGKPWGVDPRQEVEGEMWPHKRKHCGQVGADENRHGSPPEGSVLHSRLSRMEEILVEKTRTGFQGF